ncbi:MAG: hypothetical protein WDN44_05210 [Sphingomonas sp.]
MSGDLRGRVTDVDGDPLSIVAINGTAITTTSPSRSPAASSASTPTAA